MYDRTGFSSITGLFANKEVIAEGVYM